jgi:hydrogenase nickel incorporation protein HypA/HybF
LWFSFELDVADTSLEGATLHIEDVPPIAWCPRCATGVILGQPLRRRCPACDTPTPTRVSGNELELVSLEVMDVDREGIGAWLADLEQFRAG